MTTADPTITESEQREQYALTGLARLGLSFERAMQSEAIVIAINGGIKARRRLAARQSRASAIPHQLAAEAAEAESIPRIDTARFLNRYSEAP